MEILLKVRAGLRKILIINTKIQGKRREISINSRFLSNFGTNNSYYCYFPPPPIISIKPTQNSLKSFAFLRKFPFNSIYHLITL